MREQLGPLDGKKPSLMRSRIRFSLKGQQRPKGLSGGGKQERGGVAWEGRRDLLVSGWDLTDGS